MSEQNPLIGLQIDNYRIRSLIGKGGMASVYLASDLSLKRDAVIKVLLPALAENKELRLRFQREAQATARLHHPNIVQVYTTGSLPDGLPYIALQYIEGGALSDHLQQLAKQGQWISTIYALSIARQMAGALQVAHQADIVHRDLKPSNILLRMDGTPVLSDLGIAAVQQATMRLTVTGGIIGTPNYMSPEQASSQGIDGRSDIYSLGVILYELLSGHLPFDADSPWAILHQHIYEQPTPLARVRPDLTAMTASLVDTCLQKKPGDRFATAQALAAALDATIAAENANPLITMGVSQATVLEPFPSPVPELVQTGSSASQTTTAKTKTRPWWSYLLIFALLLLVGVGAFYIWQQSQDTEVIPDPEATTVPAVLVVSTAASPQPSATIAPTVLAATVPPQPADPVIDPGFASINVAVDAAVGRNDTGIEVVPGQTVSIIYEDGQWQAGPSPSWPLVGPEGDPQVSSKASFPIPDAAVASLIAGIGDAPPLFIGRGNSFVANTSGNLWLVANDDGYHDNQGNLQVLIQLGPLPEEPAKPQPTSQGVVAYSCGSDGQKQIYLFDLDQGRQLPLANQPGNSIVPAFSRDGEQIAYRSNASGTWQIVVSDVDGSNRRQVTSGGGDNYEAVWSPDSSQMAFVSDRTGSKQIFVMGSDGTNQQQLTYNDDYNDDPSWSPTGQIAYESNQDGRYSIYQLSSSGGVPLLLIDAGSSSTTPAWSADGTYIAYESRVGDVRHIWTATSEGTNLERVTSEGTDNQRPAWAPDGRKLAFHSNYQLSSDSTDIWVIDIESGDLQRLTSRGDCSDPAWGQSPATLQPEAPLVIDGVEACRLSAGDAVTAGSNTRLWETPDVLSGEALASVDSGTSLRVVGGPDWERIRQDVDISGWWWQVERESDGLTGWVWQARLLECEGP